MHTQIRIHLSLYCCLGNGDTSRFEWISCVPQLNLRDKSTDHCFRIDVVIGRIALYAVLKIYDLGVDAAALHAVTKIGLRTECRLIGVTIRELPTRVKFWPAVFDV